MEAAPLLIVEGLFVLHDPRAAELFDDSVFVDVPADVRLARRIRRDAMHRNIVRVYSGDAPAADDRTLLTLECL